MQANGWTFSSGTRVHYFCPGNPYSDDAPMGFECVQSESECNAEVDDPYAMLFQSNARRGTASFTLPVGYCGVRIKIRDGYRVGAGAELLPGSELVQLDGKTLFESRAGECTETPVVISSTYKLGQVLTLKGRHILSLYWFELVGGDMCTALSLAQQPTCECSSGCQWTGSTTASTSTPNPITPTSAELMRTVTTSPSASRLANATTAAPDDSKSPAVPKPTAISKLLCNGEADPEECNEIDAAQCSSTITQATARSRCPVLCTTCNVIIKDDAAAGKSAYTANDDGGDGNDATNVDADDDGAGNNEPTSKSAGGYVILALVLILGVVGISMYCCCWEASMNFCCGLEIGCCSTERQAQWAGDVSRQPNPLYEGGTAGAQVPMADAQTVTSHDSAVQGAAYAVAVETETVGAVYLGAGSNAGADGVGVRLEPIVTNETYMALHENVVVNEETEVVGLLNAAVRAGGVSNEMYEITAADDSYCRGGNALPQQNNFSDTNSSLPPPLPPALPAKVGSGGATDTPDQPGQVPALSSLNNHHGNIDRAVAEQRLRAAGTFRYLLREKSGGGDGTVVSYIASGTTCKHSRITRSTDGSAYHLDNKPLTAASPQATMQDAVAAAVAVIASRLGAAVSLDLVCAPPLDGTPGRTMSNNTGYVNTRYEVMAAILSELPIIDRFQAEQKLGAAGIDGGFLLRQKKSGEEKVVISCLTKGTCEHYVMGLVEASDKLGATWVHKSERLPEITMLEAAIGLLNDKQVPNAQCISDSSTA